MDGSLKQLAAPFRIYVNADKDRNTLCITASPGLLQRIADDLKIIDKAPEHIMLHARIFVLDRSGTSRSSGKRAS